MTARRSEAPGTRAGARGALSDAAVARLPLYLAALTALAADGRTTASSEELAAATGVGAAALRKDLSQLGTHGTRGVGYDVERLAAQIAEELGTSRARSVVIVGVGRLGQALADYDGFASRGFRVRALLDADPALAGHEVAGLAVRPVDELEAAVAGCTPCIGVIATPAAAAQGVCDRLVAAGVRSILTFAPVVLAVPEEVDVRRVDLSLELQVLAFHAQRRPGGLPSPAQAPAQAPAPAAAGVTA
ncbi:redox-sensing transcriptional repressor Rex [Vallicoccus soli]|uniref:Redox-sensing transcriptional repressor Rex n=1 Tax=Vallicoccus soli TaxID=2339232 RepID=A0A3A3YZ40_9ACTN|nr:redox-sensing transcriptional repressor Rex [Vallicoccus soli]RJK96082.1 redox-sensing transcriptional repressor Rex [Vallicoccus soli]